MAEAKTSFFIKKMRWLEQMSSDPADSTDSAVAIKIRAWPIFDEIFPRVKKAILSSPRNLTLPTLRKAIEEYENMIEQIRHGTGVEIIPQPGAQLASHAGLNAAVDRMLDSDNDRASKKGRLSGARRYGSPK
jgi:hypothetical protein